jgi:predicted TIM-barrel fold metal-dependent hydrolase
VTGRLGLAGAMITEYPLEHLRYDQSEYEPFWAAAAALDLPLGLHTATRWQGRIPGAGDKTLRDAGSRATKAFYPALSMCDLIFSGVFERHPRLTLAIVEFELAWAPHLLSTMDYTYRERHGEAIYRFKGLPSRRRGRHAPERLLPAPDRDPGIAGGNTARVYNFDVARLTAPA